MNAQNDISIRISPRQGQIVIEEDADGVLTRKRIDRSDLVQCFRESLVCKDERSASGFLPLNTIAVDQTSQEKRFTVWYPRLYADVSLYDTPYPHFPIPRLVSSFALSNEGKVSRCRIGVVDDETPSPGTAMYHYPFSNVGRNDHHLCIGANELPVYKMPHKATTLPAFLLSIPNNMHYFNTTDNRLGMEYRELMEHLKDKDPAYYYSDILIPSGKTLGQFIKQM